MKLFLKDLSIELDKFFFEFLEKNSFFLSEICENFYIFALLIFYNFQQHARAHSLLNKYMARILYKGDIKLLEFKHGLDVTFNRHRPIMDTFEINLKPLLKNEEGKTYYNPKPLMKKIDFTINKKVINFDKPLDWLEVYNEDFSITNLGKSQISYQLQYDRRLMNIRYDTGIIDAESTIKFKIDFGLVFYANDKCCDLYQLAFGSKSSNSTEIKIKIGDVDDAVTITFDFKKLNFFGKTIAELCAEQNIGPDDIPYPYNVLLEHSETVLTKNMTFNTWTGPIFYTHLAKLLRATDNNEPLEREIYFVRKDGERGDLLCIFHSLILLLCFYPEKAIYFKDSEQSDKIAVLQNIFNILKRMMVRISAEVDKRIVGRNQIENYVVEFYRRYRERRLLALATIFKYKVIDSNTTGFNFDDDSNENIIKSVRMLLLD